MSVALPDKLRRARLCLWILAAIYGLVSCLALLFLFGAVAAAVVPEGTAEDALTFGFLGLGNGFVGLLGLGASLTGAVGIGRGSKVGWAAGLVMGGLSMLSCATIPLGIFILMGLLDAESREHLGV